MIIHDTICEEILVPLRGILAHKLSERGLSQHKISSILHVSQPMVFKLLRKGIGEYISELERAGLERGIIEHYSNVLCDLALNSPHDKFILVSYQVINMLALRVLCSKSGFTQVCVAGLPVDPDIEHYKAALSRLISLRGLHKLIPEVGSNLVYAPKPPSSITGIIGLTGRITRTLNGVTVSGEPMYGGSRHLSQILLLASSINPGKRVGFNIKYDPRYVKALEKLGLKLATTGPHEDQDSFWNAVERASKEKPDVIVDLGGRGLEPVIYIFTSSFDELEHVLAYIVESAQ